VEPLSLCINSQTPLVQFLAPSGANVPDPSGRGVVDLAKLREDVDFRYSPGGVTRMVYPLVRRLVERGVVRDAHWIALNPNAPRTVLAEGMTLHNVALDGDRMSGYGKVKEAIWGRIHETDGTEPHDDLFWSEAFSEYSFYNRLTAERIRELDARHDFDAFYIHDFQQLAVGQMLGTLKPKIFRWHIPFDASVIPEHWREVLTSYLSGYDVVVVSAKGYADSLKALRPKGKIVRIYPYVDPNDYSRPAPEAVAAASQTLGLTPEDTVALLVGRMDPIKGQDLAIAAFANVAPRYPNLKLVLVGNGSFSGSRGGVGLSKSSAWRTQLESQAEKTGLGARVVFAGHLPQHELDCLYERCEFTLLPSVREGFGLVAVESWLHDRPAIVTNRAGIAEIIEDGVNGLLFDPSDPAALTRKMKLLLDDDAGRLHSRLVKNGRTAARKCSLDAAVRSETAMLEKAMEA
jgi:glycosyltransferase involved in cell wall biosynthesis